MEEFVIELNGGVARLERLSARERVAAYRDAGVATLAVTPMAFTLDERLDQLRQMAAIAL